MNKDKAMQMLKSKLYLLAQKENADKAAGIRGEVSEIGWGSQIRSYVMQPYTMVMITNIIRTVCTQVPRRNSVPKQ